MNGISIVCDTNPLIYLLDGNSQVAELLDEKQVWVSVISELELFGKRGLSKDEIAEINHLLDNCFIAELSPQIKKIVKELIQKYNIKLPDAIIAATALYLDMPLLTADKEFNRLPNLKLILIEF
jgi:predicted nucleic acid-binding protein